MLRIAPRLSRHRRVIWSATSANSRVRYIATIAAAIVLAKLLLAKSTNVTYWCTSDTLLTKSLNLRVHTTGRDEGTFGLDLRTATQAIDYGAKNLRIIHFCLGSLMRQEHDISRYLSRVFDSLPSPFAQLAFLASLRDPYTGSLSSRRMGDRVLYGRIKRDIARYPPECFCKCRRLIAGRSFSGIEEALSIHQ